MSDLIRREDALALRDKLADIIGALPMSSIHSALSEYRNAIRALPAVQPKVKPLVWEGAEGEDITAQPDRFHTYVVRKLSEKIFDVILSHELGSLWFRQSRNEVWPDYTTAKAAAQADYEARSLSALEPAVQRAHVNEKHKSEHDAANVLAKKDAEKRK